MNTKLDRENQTGTDASGEGGGNGRNKMNATNQKCLSSLRLGMPEKFEAIEGKLFWSDEQRLHVLAMLLEAVGIKRALALCPPEAIRAALAEQKR